MQTCSRIDSQLNKMQKIEFLMVGRQTFLAFLLLFNCLRVVTFGISAGISHHQINKKGSHAVQSSDVIQIDCGCEPDSSAPGYLSDALFIDTGKNLYIQPQYSIPGLDQVLKTVRSFPDGERNCYTLNPSSGANHSYLVQLRFMYGNYDQRNYIPIFDVFIGTNPWRTVNLNKTDVKLFIEMIYKPITEYIHICLVNIGQGTPFISEIVLRSLNSSTIYNSNLGALQTSTRYHTLFFAPSDDNSYYDRYTDDPYTRLWAPLPHTFGENWKIRNLGKELITLNNDRYEIPSSILKSRAEPLPGKNRLNMYHTPDSLKDEVHYFYWHFVEIEKLREGELREFFISMVGNITLGPIRPVYLKELTIVSPPLKLGPGDTKIWFSIIQTNASSLPPILNAVEVMVVINVSHVTTNPDDVKAIMDVKRSYPFITGWQADPCLPKVPWDNLICSKNNSVPPTIISLNLSSKGLTGEILPSLSRLTSLTYLDLSNNSLTGRIPEFLAKLPSLKVLNLRENNLSGSVPVALMDKVKNNSFSMSLDNNPYLCTSALCIETKSKKHHILALVVASSAALIVVLTVAVVFGTIKWRKGNNELASLSTNDGRIYFKNRQFKYFEVIHITNNFQRVLGKGAYGTVYYGSLEDSTEVAVKMLNQPSALMSFQIEAELLMRIHHRNLVSLIGYCNERESMALIYEYMANGNLLEHLSGNKSNTFTSSWKERLQIAIDVAQGLDYLHNGCKPAIVHRDMKTANILLDGKLQARIADFGTSKIFATESATHFSTDHVVGTPGYLDPEYQISFRLNEKSDVYSFGVILLELLTGKPPIIIDATESLHISNWVTPLLHHGEIWSIVDQRLGTDFNINSAWKFLEIAVSCVPNVQIRRPTMPQVFAELKECLELELVHQKAKNGLDVQPSVSSTTHNTFDIIQVDIESNMGPRAT